jgi:hypothetical protein
MISAITAPSAQYHDDVPGGWTVRPIFMKLLSAGELYAQWSLRDHTGLIACKLPYPSSWTISVCMEINMAIQLYFTIKHPRWLDPNHWVLGVYGGNDATRSIPRLWSKCCVAANNPENVGVGEVEMESDRTEHLSWPEQDEHEEELEDGELEDGEIDIGDYDNINDL